MYPSGYRREAKAQANLQEGRHDLGRTVFHGHKGEVTRAYLDGMENQLSALGLILNCIVLWNSVYLDRAVHPLRAQDYPVRDEDATRLSAFMRKHLRLAPTISTCPSSAAPTGRYATRTARRTTSDQRVESTA
ncbi:Tn3 family transposase [Nocardia sienata]|uniref:Tn3 family transposase n=1 Tax=Nocardia sienata TaxID=248552 RepID=UPI000A5CA890|nr:Tn3 family transposase [Nocardia sienata]